MAGSKKVNGLTPGTKKGFSYIELSLVVAILGIVAVVALPSFTGSDSYKVELAAQRIADALRYARGLAIARGELVGVTVDHGAQLVEVFEPDLSATPVGALAIEYDPLTKQPYTFKVDTMPATSGALIVNTAEIFDFVSFGRKNAVLFDGQGTPVWYLPSNGITSQLKDAVVELQFGAHRAEVRLEPISGRVTVQ